MTEPKEYTCEASSTFRRQSGCEDKFPLPSEIVCGDCHYLRSHPHTPAPAPDEHCKNEGRCFDFCMAPKEWVEGNICHLCGCDGDTRSRPHIPASVPAPHFIIDSGLRAEVTETLRQAGCPCLAEQVLKQTMPDYQVENERERLREKYVEYMNHPCPELAEKYKHGCDAEYCGLCILDEVLESRRKSGEV